MTPEQEKHLEIIKIVFNVKTNIKYRRGQEEHGGNLWDKSLDFLIESAIEEAIDQFTYLVTLKTKLESMGLLEPRTGKGSLD